MNIKTLEAIILSGICQHEPFRGNPNVTVSLQKYYDDSIMDEFLNIEVRHKVPSKYTENGIWKDYTFDD